MRGRIVFMERHFGKSERARAAASGLWYRMKPFLGPLAGFLVVAAGFFLAASVDFSVIRDAVDGLAGKTVRAESLSPEWITRYSIVMNGRIRPDDDADHDGLGFVAEQAAGTNPYDADTDDDGAGDAEELSRGTDPLGSGELDTDADGMPDPWEMARELDSKAADADVDPDGDGLPNIGEYAYGTDPHLSDTDGDGFGDAAEIGNGYDPDAPGDTKPSVTVLIEKVGVAAPMIWSSSDDDTKMLSDLKNGVIRYPDSGVPGQPGNVIIAGHSSNYAWAQGDYNSVFRRLGELAAGDVVILRAKQANGRTFDYRYRLTEKRVTTPDDPWIFEDDGADEVTLSTCWPLGTAFRRLVLRGEMEEGEDSAS
ncbi:MAG: sortase [Candidatus Moranbacteria bacterium]|nr:sortase [Candidatus Moranbacteria bacterium]